MGKTASSAGIENIKKDEGSIDGLYNDPSGYCTFGVGHLVHTIEKWECLLLAGASSGKICEANVKKESTAQVQYLERAVVGAKEFEELKKKAIERAKETVSKKKHQKAFAGLSEAEKQSVTSVAEAGVREEARLLTRTVSDVLQEDVKPFEQAVSDAVTAVVLTQEEFDALVSLAFNIGTSNLKSSNLVKKINENKYRTGEVKNREVAIDEIEKEFPKWNKSGGKVLTGLTTRRKDEAARFLKNAKEELDNLKKAKK